MGQVLSVNVGKAGHIDGFKPLTGIVKQPVAGLVEIGVQGVADDAICDRRHHGGSEQAVYVYVDADYEFWARELQRRIAPGTFGENLTIAGIDGTRLAVGDRLQIGPVLLEVSYHRTPCMTFAARMGEHKWVKRFHNAGRPGAYCRVLAPGSVAAGMAVDYTPFAGERVTVAELMALDGVRTLDPAFLRRALQTPIRERTRLKYEEQLAQLF